MEMSIRLHSSLGMEMLNALILLLHWLPVRQRVLFKTAVLVFQCLAGQAPVSYTHLTLPTILRV